MASKKIFYPTFFLWFFILYCLPIFFCGILDAAVDPRVLELKAGVITEYSMGWELVKFLFNFVFIIFLFFLPFLFLYDRLASALNYSGVMLGFLLFLCLFVWVACFNILYFPKSSYSLVLGFLPAPKLIFIFGLVFLAGCVLIVSYLCSLSRRAVLLSVFIVSSFSLLSVGAKPGDGTAHRNVVILGVDSMSAAVYQENSEYFPNISALLESGINYSNAYTTLGRTYPAWVTILSGKPAAENGAFFNLRDMSFSAQGDLLTISLSDKGYFNLFALDERRFNNMDRSFGFDRIIGPKAGAMDFIVQRYVDSPILNLVLQHELSGYAFPWSWINVASHANYSASGFVKSIVDAIDYGSPLFLAVHFESGHFPYKSRHSKSDFEHENGFFERYVRALGVVDRQVGMLMNELRRSGVLNDALVILLSDHGEAVGIAEKTFDLKGNEIEFSSYGHGSNIVSDKQNRIVLGINRYVDGEAILSSREEGRLVSLLGIKEVIERYVDNGEVGAVRSGECFIVETGIRFKNASNYKTLSEIDLAVESASYYTITPDGLLQLREDKIHELVDRKDIGYRCEDSITWYSAIDQDYYALSLGENPAAGPLRMIPVAPEIRSMIETYKASYFDKGSLGDK